MVVYPYVDIYTKTRNHRKTFLKTQAENNLVKTKKLLNTEI